jgi:uncharacterized protein YdaU (DUF1376 family)
MAPEKAPAFQFYPKDFLTDGRVSGMSLSERGAYITLLSLCWLERSLPRDLTRLARQVGVPRAHMARLWPAIAPCFKDDPANGERLIHPRLELERQKQETYRRRQSDKGKASAANRKATEPQPDVNRGSTERPTKPQPAVNSPVSSLQIHEKKNTSRGTPKERGDPRVRDFLTWFQSEYTARRHGADYLVKWDRDGALVKQMLGATDLEKLKKYAQIMLSDRCEDEFITLSDRGITILSAKFNWLSERYAAWVAAKQPAVSA